MAARSTAVPLGRVLLRWGTATLLLGTLLGGTLWGSHWLLVPGNVPLQRIRVDGELRHTRREELERALAQRLDGSFFGLDLQAVRRGVEALPWVERASIRRVWPGTLVVAIREREALAYWGDGAVVSPRAQVFRPDARSVPADLARLQGPELSAAEVVEGFRWMRDCLAPHGLEIKKLVLSERHAWTLELDDGVRLFLGTRDLEPRLERYLAFLPQLREQGRAQRVDLRYTNGFSVLWHAPGMGGTQTGSEG